MSSYIDKSKNLLTISKLDYGNIKTVDFNGKYN